MVVLLMLSRHTIHPFQMSYHHNRHGKIESIIPLRFEGSAFSFCILFTEKNTGSTHAHICKKQENIGYDTMMSYKAFPITINADP